MIELFTVKFNFAVMLELLTQFSVVSIVFVFHIFIVFYIIFCLIKPKIIKKTSRRPTLIYVMHKSVVAVKTHDLASGIFVM